MKFFPVTIVDDIFEHVEDVLDIAKNISYQPKGYNNFPGQISGDIKDLSLIHISEPTRPY